MTNTSTPSIPAGWYPDPEGDPRPRWWDGTQWTAHYAEPAAPPNPTTTAGYAQLPYAMTPGSALRAPEGAPTSNQWIWLLVLLPIASVAWTAVTLATMNPTEFVTGGSPIRGLASFAVSVLVIGLTVLFAVLDWRALRAAGVPQPFHWAWSFFALLITSGAVYAIGRSVIVRRRTGAGMAPLWATIVVLVLQFAVFMVSFVMGVMAGMQAAGF